MFDATKLLGEFMQNRAAPSATGRLDTVANQSAGGGGSLGSMLSGLGGGGGGLSGLLSQLTSSAQSAAGTARTEVAANNPMAIGGLGALAGALLGGGRGAVGGGLMAVLGSLVVSALQGSGQTAAQPAATAMPPAALPATQDEVQDNARLLLRAMISAAKADGQIDSREMDKIMGRLREGGSDPEAQQFVLQEMSKPADVAGLAAEARSPQLAVQVYAVSLLAIEVDTPAERQYMGALAQALHLQPATVAQVHQAMGVPA